MLSKYFGTSEVHLIFQTRLTRNPSSDPTPPLACRFRAVISRTHTHNACPIYPVRGVLLGQTMQSLVWRLFPGRFGDEASFLPRLRELAEVAPSVLVLQEPADGAGGVEDEFQAAEPQSEVRGCAGEGFGPIEGYRGRRWELVVLAAAGPAALLL